MAVPLMAMLVILLMACTAADGNSAAEGNSAEEDDD